MNEDFKKRLSVTIGLAAFVVIGILIGRVTNTTNDALPESCMLFTYADPSVDSNELRCYDPEEDGFTQYPPGYGSSPSTHSAPSSVRVYPAIGEVTSVVASGTSVTASPAGEGLTYRCADGLLSASIELGQAASFNNTTLALSQDDPSSYGATRLALGGTSYTQAVAVIVSSTNPLTTVNGEQAGELPTDQSVAVLPSQDVASYRWVSMTNRDFTDGLISGVTVCFDPAIVPAEQVSSLPTPAPAAPPTGGK